MQTLRAGALYFALVFAAGFLLGPIRIFWVVPRVGTRTAELLEAPIMLAVTVAAARWVVRRLTVPADSTTRLIMGTISLALMLFVEFALVVRLRGLSPLEYLATRDPVSGTAYYVSLIIFALMPLIIARARWN